MLTIAELSVAVVRLAERFPPQVVTNVLPLVERFNCTVQWSQHRRPLPEIANSFALSLNTITFYSFATKCKMSAYEKKYVIVSL